MLTAYAPEGAMKAFMIEQAYPERRLCLSYSWRRLCLKKIFLTTNQPDVAVCFVSLSNLVSFVRCFCFRTVIIICHANTAFMQRILFRAQDRQMTTGEYALYTFGTIVTSSTFEPWNGYDFTGEDFQYRIQAFYALKQVHNSTTV